MRIRQLIIKALSLGPKHVREICCFINNKPYSYCMNVNGKGGRCKYWYHRPKHESQAIKLVEPNCKTKPSYIIKVLKELEKNGYVKSRIEIRTDKLSPSGFDHFRVYYLSVKICSQRS